MHEPSTAPSRTPPVDMIGNYVLAESTQKVNPRDGMTYEVSAGEYPVMGLLSADRTRVENAGIVFRAANTATGDIVSVVEKLRPIDIPALVQRQQIRMEAKPDRSLRYPLSMFLGEASDLSNKRAAEKRQAEDRAQEQTEGQKMRLSR
jgi:hypothetical protein